MKTMYFESFDQFDESGTAGLYEVISVVKKEKCNTICADLMTDCKSYKTALNRFFRGLSEYRQFDGWEEALKESCGNGIFKDSETYWNDETLKSEYKGGWFYEIEDNDGSFYICLNVTDEQ